LLSSRATARGYFDVQFIDRLVDEHASGRREHTLRLWALVIFELWHRQYLDDRRSAVSACSGHVAAAAS